MLMVLDLLIFFSLVILLIALIMQNDKNTKSILKVQAYTCIVALMVESISVVVRFLVARYWFPVLLVLVLHAIISYGIINEAKDNGVFEKKKKDKKKVNVDVVV